MTVAGVTYHSFVLDLGPDSVDGWLRRKLGDDASMVESVRGIGYVYRNA